MKESINQIKKELQFITAEDRRIQEWRKDERKGVRVLLEKWDRKQEIKEKLMKEREEMLHYEKKEKDAGFIRTAGIDEVGRGPLAGPVIAAAVILHTTEPPLGMTDSKKLSEKKRTEFNEWICTNASVGIGRAEAWEIDTYNIYQASRLAMKRAAADLPQLPDSLLIDAMEIESDVRQTSLVKGDTRSVSIAAASIVAKVKRDEWMKQLAEKHPGYGFENHAGYGTKEHLQAITDLGLIDEHRRSF
ncbi:MAG: ribonuclease HII, partial [Alkalicoccus sp.]